jgi:hypothetical protein
LHVLEVQRQRLARPQARVGEHGHERRAAHVVAGQQVASHPLDDRGGHGSYDVAASAGRLAHDLRGIRRDVAPLDGALKDALQDHEDAALRGEADAGCGQLAAVALQDLRGQLAQAQAADARQHVAVPHDGVGLKRRAGEVGLAVDLPPLARQLGERHLRTGRVDQLARALAAADVGVEGFGVALAPEHLGLVLAALAPAHAPYDAALTFQSFDAHAAGLRLLSMLHRPSGVGALRVPGCRARGGGVVVRSRSIQSRKSSGWMRKREHTRLAVSSPRLIAR